MALTGYNMSDLLYAFPVPIGQPSSPCWHRVMFSISPEISVKNIDFSFHSRFAIRHSPDMFPQLHSEIVSTKTLSDIQ